MNISRTAIVAALVLGASGTFFSADAAKTKFERNKPHVNVGTIGNAGGSAGSGNLQTGD